LPEELSGLPFLAMMERTVALIPEAFAGSTSVQQFVTAPFDEVGPVRLFVGDWFSNPAHVQFALRGTLAAMACYITYTAIDWQGLSTSIPTCFITALTTVGSSRQKQILRLGGAIIGGFVFGTGAQIFVLPYLNTIAGFTVLFAVVTFIAAWIGTASARLSYLGVQLALAFYLINLQEFTIQTSLSIARDRVFGVLLGLLAMWLLYDRLWVRNAVDEMEAAFIRNLQMFAELAEQMLEPDQVKKIRRIRRLRDQLNAGFEAVKAQADAVLFEFGPSRKRKLQVRDEIRRWQPSIRTLLQVQITSAQYLSQKPLQDMPGPIAQAGVAFEKDIAHVMRAMADMVAGKPVGSVPDIRLSAAQMRRQMSDYYQQLGVPLPDESYDVMGLADSLATILAPLYEDIRETFASRGPGVGAQVQLAHGEA
jgi:multidrug resistance protein MdtO